MTQTRLSNLVSIILNMHMTKGHLIYLTINVTSEPRVLSIISCTTLSLKEGHFILVL